MPKKWRVEDHSASIRAEYTIISEEGGGFPETVAHVPAYLVGDIGRKRAALIAKAPEMLTLISELLGCSELNMDDMEPETLATIDKVRNQLVDFL